MQAATAESIQDPAAGRAEADAPEEPAVILRRWLPFDGDSGVNANDLLCDGPGVEAVVALCAGVVLPDGDEQRAATLIAAGADCVYVGEAALLDSSVIARLVAAHGAESIGIYAPLQRQNVSWYFETVSNVDFRTVAPSHCEPAWEVLRADGSGTGTLAAWWLKAMRELGASRFLVRVDIHDDTDLNICAGLVEDFGDALWIGPLLEPEPKLADWVDFGQCRQLALPAAIYAQCLDRPDAEKDAE